LLFRNAFYIGEELLLRIAQVPCQFGPFGGGDLRVGRKSRQTEPQGDGEEQYGFYVLPILSDRSVPRWSHDRIRSRTRDSLEAVLDAKAAFIAVFDVVIDVQQA
jgi:hypothetical protein